MAKSPIKRKSAEQYNLDANAWVKGRVRDILKSLVEADPNKGSRTISFKGDLKRLEDRLKKRLDSEIKRIFPRIAGKLIGTYGGVSFTQVYYLYPSAFDDNNLAVSAVGRIPAGDPTGKRSGFLAAKAREAQASGEALAIWEPLKHSTVLRKGNSKFFEDTGQLRHYLQGVDGLSKLGETRVLVSTVGFTPGAENVKVLQLAKITVVLFPNLPARQRAILTADSFRPDPKGALEYGIFNAEIREKLAGPKSPRTQFRYRYRPLVPPVLRWYLAYKLPTIAASTIAGFNFRKPTGDA